MRMHNHSINDIVYQGKGKSDLRQDGLPNQSSEKGCIHPGDRRKKTCCCKCNGSSIERNTKQEMKMFVNAFLIPEIFNSLSVPFQCLLTINENSGGT